jgi:exosome complex component RRP45
MVFHTSFSKMSSGTIEEGRNMDEINTSRMLEKALRKSRAIDTEGLCIVAGEKVWAIRVHIAVLDQDGNILDCAGLAAMAALLHFRRPDVTVTGEDVVIHPADEKVPIALGIHHIPICITFAFFMDGERHVIDPSLLEESVSEAQLTLVVNIHRELCTLSKAGGIGISPEKVLHCATIASVKAEELTAELKKAIEMVTCL